MRYLPRWRLCINGTWSRGDCANFTMSLPTFTLNTTGEEVADAFAEQIQGKNVLITGTSLNGIGFETARVIAKHAKLVVITGYNLERLKLSEEAIKREIPTANIRTLVLDLTSLAAVRIAAAEVNAYQEPLHVLINNAAAGSGPFRLTEDKFEMQMGAGHIGPFLLTNLLVPKLLASGAATYIPRVVFVSSAAHAWCSGVDFEQLEHPLPEKYVNFSTYQQVKCANILTAIELSKRAKDKMNVYSLHPGAILTNMNQTEDGQAEMKAAGILDADGRPTDKFSWKTIPQGAATTVAAAFDTRLEDKSGAFLWDSVEANAKIAPHSSDPANAEKLWSITERLVGEKFTF
ncbi:hypothetical protein C8R43DRAFT_1016586 [Mycena crocata]|nr:hypothetical protein C8R43DRAFT_1016586 [Mycena crocata]